MSIRKTTAGTTLKIYWQHACRHRGTMAALLLMLVFAVGGQSIDPLIAKWIVEAMQAGDAHAAWLLVDKTTLIIAHRLATVKQCDRIVVLHDGTVAEDGTHAELLGRGDASLYKKLFDLQTQGYLT